MGKPVKHLKTHNICKRRKLLLKKFVKNSVSYFSLFATATQVLDFFSLLL